MEELNTLKRELKCWENMFERKHGRRPNKDDIRNASDEIRDTYVKYKHLKEANAKIKNKTETEEEDDGVFGKKCNKQFEHKQPLATVRLKNGWANIKPVRLCHGQRPKSKDISPTEKKSENENSHEAKSNDNEIETMGLTVVAISNATKTPRRSCTPNQITSSFRKTPGTSESRLKRRASLYATSLKKIENKAEEENAAGNDFKGKEDLVASIKTNEALARKGSVELDSSESYSCREYEDQDDENHHHENKKMNDLCETRDDLNSVESSSMRTEEAEQVTSNSDRKLVTDLRTTTLNGNPSLHCEDSLSSRPSHIAMDYGLSHTKKPRITIECEKSNRAAKHTNSGGHCEKTEYEETEKPSARDTPRIGKEEEQLHVDSCNAIGPDGHSDTTDTERAYENKNTRKRKAEPEVVSDVRMPDLKKKRADKLLDLCDNRNTDGSEEEQDTHSDEGPDEAFEEVKIKTGTSKARTSSSGLVSENFVRLNMKHKAYRRRGHGMTGSAYKRRAFNNIMKARGEYVSKSSWSRRGAGGRGGRGGGRGSWGASKGTTGACYKCGQEGHWAKNCKGKAATPMRELPEEDDDKEEFTPEDDTFIQELTLEKAAQMAAGVTVDEDTMDRGLVILPHQLPRPAYVPPSPPEAIEPLFETIDRKINETPKEVYTALGQLGFSTFRSGQEEAIVRILSGVSSLVVLSTGAGKSLCYQLPAYMYYKRFPCLSLVISPLVSLMEDQISGLPFGLQGACLHTNQTKAQREKILEHISSGKIAVLLLSPEALVGRGSGGGCLPASTRLPPIAFACIDEAHCLSEWSHNFRPSYLRVCKVLRERFGVRCFLGLTATATRATAASVAQHLGISNDEGAVIRGAAVPPNLYLSVSRDRNRDKALIELLQGPRFSKCESIIIYCTRREVTERVATLVRTCLQHMTPVQKPTIDDLEEQPTKKNSKKRGKKKAPRAPLTWEAESYHAGMTPAQRRRVQTRFMSGELRLVVATVAFGMGLDKSDVRAIIHYNMPKSFESYVQEIGRAGRDGLPSHCHVFLDREGKDMCELRRHIHSNTVDRVIVKKLVNKLFPRCECLKLHRAQKGRESQRLAAKEAEDMEDDSLITDDMLSQISEEQMINGAGNPPQENDKLEQLINSCNPPQENDKLEQLINSGNPPQENDKLEQLINSGNPPQENDKLEQLINSGNSPQEDNLTSSESKLLRNPQPILEEEGLERKDGNTNPAVVEAHNQHDFSSCEQRDKNDEDNISEELSNVDHESSCPRICGGHDVAMPTESAVQELDMPEESIATLLCYLELHQKCWLEVLKPVRSTCTVKFYGGPAHLKAVAKRIPPIAAALVHCEKKERKFKKQSSLVFPIVEIADKMGWDLDPVYKELWALQWNSSLAPDSTMSSSGQSGILVEFSDNSIHVRAPGDLSDDERDEVCDFLDDRIQAEEQTQLKQLAMLYSSLHKVSCSEYWQCSEEVDKDSDIELKTLIKAFFEDLGNATQIELESLKKKREDDACCTDSSLPDEHVNWDGISRDIRTLTNIHHDQSFTGRAVARIFHGISSPCYLAEVWGRDRRFWRRHLDVDFNSLRRFAIRELLKLR